MNFIGSKTLETERLILRKTEESDLIPLWEMLVSPDMNRYYFFNKVNSKWEKEKNWQVKKLKEAGNPDIFAWSIVVKDSNKLIGKIMMPEVPCEDVNDRDLVIYITPEEQRKGYAYEACLRAFEYMFNEAGISLVQVCTPTENEAGIALLNKLDFLKEGSIKTLKYPNAGRFQCFTFNLTKDRFKRKKIEDLEN